MVQAYNRGGGGRRWRLSTVLSLYVNHSINKRPEREMFQNIGSHLYQLGIKFLSSITSCVLDEDIAINVMKLCEFS